MYDYRRLTPEQQVEVVAHRVSRGFPWHKPPHPDCGSGWYLITAACYEHQHYFCEPNELTALQRRLFEALAEAHCECGGWVVLPNHYHLLIKLTDIKLSGFGRAIGKVHGRSALYANRRDAAPKRHVWYKSPTARFAPSDTFGPVCTTSSKTPSSTATSMNRSIGLGPASMNVWPSTDWLGWKACAATFR